jgi:HD-GYP domain-containing protein (c-di-GMP phosphodiesterase class II)
LVEVFLGMSQLDEFWEPLKAHDLEQQVMTLEPEEHIRLADEDYLDRVAKGFAMVVDSKSPFTAGHSERVAVYTDMIAEKLGYEPSRRRWLRRAALLHDLGKLAISNQILDKTSRLTEAEYAIVKTHPRISGEILAGIPAFKDIVPVAGGHHERLDGKGYPFGLSGELISLDTRIVTTADVFDALTADRPYRKAQPVDQVLEMMSKDLGTAFDERCFEALTAALKQVNLKAA